MRVVDRKIEIPHEGPFCDLMWSDPEEIESWALSNRYFIKIFYIIFAKQFNNIICNIYTLK